MTNLHRKAAWEYAGHTDHAKGRAAETDALPRRGAIPALPKSDRSKRQPHEHLTRGGN